MRVDNESEQEGARERSHPQVHLTTVVWIGVSVTSYELTPCLLSGWGEGVEETWSVESSLLLPRVCISWKLRSVVGLSMERRLCDALLT